METANGTATKSGADSLEQLLLARNKKVGDELTLLRVSHNNLQDRLQSLQDELSNTTTELEKYRNLSVTLENDLLKVQEEASNALPSSALSTAGTHLSRYPHTSAGGSRRFKTSPTSSIISGFDPLRASQTSLESIRGGEAGGGGSGLLPMVTAQRDRFRQRNAQVEEELSKTYRTVTSLRQEIASLQKDNLALYEKTRYASSFHRGPTATTTSSSAYHPTADPPLSTIPASTPASSGATVDRYRSEYEASISPFAAFRARESTRAYRRMSLPERVVFSVIRFALATRVSRNLFAAYCLALHLFVLALLYRVGTVDVERHPSPLGEAPVGPPR